MVVTRNLLICILICSSTLNTAQSEVAHSNSHLGLQIARDLKLIETHNRTGLNYTKDKLTEVGITLEIDPILKVYLHFSEHPLTSTLDIISKYVKKIYKNTWVPPVGAHQTGFLSARIKSSMVPKLLAQKEVVRITSAYRQLQPLNNLAAIQTGAREAWEQETPLTGEGVRIAVMDSGYETDHPDLPEAVFARDYADFPDVDDDVEDLISGHGTHVAGTVFGSGALSDGLYKGMAPDADPIYLKIGNDTTSSASAEAVVEAIRGAVEDAEADIITMSYGGFDGFNDGSSTEEQMVDWAVSQGVTAFMSAGNSGNYRKHYTANIAANSTTDDIQVVIKRAPPNVEWDVTLSWYDGPDTSVHVELEAVIVDGDGEEIWQEELAWVSSPRGTEARLYNPIEPAPEDSSSFYIRVTNHSNQAQKFHLLLASSYVSLRFRHAQKGYLVLLPSTADDCISVGAGTQRSHWINYEGNEHGYDNAVIGDIASFSSPGPRIDEVLKPDIVAPGKVTISCRDRRNVPLDGVLYTRIISNEGESGLPADYAAFEGTSMSSPAAAGSAALVLQADPDLSPADLRWKLFSAAQVDSLTGETPNTTWGWGKIDVITALETSVKKPYEDIIPLVISIESIYPNPFNSSFTVSFHTDHIGSTVITLTDLMGRIVSSEERYIAAPGKYSWSLAEITKSTVSGTYFLALSTNNVRSYRKIVLEK